MRCASAEALPFPDLSFDAAIAVLSDHHWSDPIAGLREMRRVAHRVVVFQWDNELASEFWLVRDYLPEFGQLAAAGPGLRERAAVIGARMESVPIPWDCVDGFFHACWRRPEAYLNEHVRRGSSVWARLGTATEKRATTALRTDLSTGRWRSRNSQWLGLEAANVGARLLVADSSA